MQKKCKGCGGAFEITSDDLNFYEEVSPVIGSSKMNLPPPTHCPECRFIRRLSFRNERFLYHRKSDLTGKQIVSIYAADKPYVVYDQDEFWSDRWDELSYGREFDFGKTFSEQFSALGLSAPHQALFTTNVENSYYTNHTLNMRNCYLLFGGGNSEDCLFGRFVIDSKNCLDGLSLYSCQWCYEGSASQNCYECFFFSNCRNCSSSLMIEDCQSCKNCCLCFGLQNREYCFLNEQMSKEEYQKRISALFPLTNATIENLKSQLEKLRMPLPHRGSHIYGSEDCTGDMIFSSKNCHYSFDITDGEDSNYLCYTPKALRSYDCTYNAPDGVKWACEAGSTVSVEHAFSTFLCWYGDNQWYSRECHGCSDIFGCISLRKKKHCILNKQYTKEEYETLVPKIIEHMRKTEEWGEHFDPSLSYMGYNETVAHEQFPKKREEVEAKGWHWYEDREKKEAYLGPAISPPLTINEVPDSVCDQILRCSISGKPFKIIPQELKFYRTMGLSLPSRCPDQRHADRVAARNPRRLWDRTCAKCGKQMKTTFSPDHSEVIYCEECYLSSVN